MFNMMRQMTNVTAASDMRNIGTAKYQCRVTNSKNDSIGFSSGVQGSGLSDREILFAFQLFYHFRQQGGVILLKQMIDARSRHAQLSQGGGGRVPGTLPFLPFRQEQLADQFCQPLSLDDSLAVIIPLDDLLLIWGVIRHRSTQVRKDLQILILLDWTSQADLSSSFRGGNVSTLGR